MEITYDAISRFVLKNGEVGVIDTTGKTRMIGNHPDCIELIEKADRFRFNGIWYSREGFAKLIAETDMES